MSIEQTPAVDQDVPTISETPAVDVPASDELSEQDLDQVAGGGGRVAMM